MNAKISADDWGVASETAVMRALLAACRRDDASSTGIRFLQYGSGPLAGRKGCAGIWIADAAVPTDLSDAGTWTLDTVGGLPAFETVALLPSRSGMNEGWAPARARSWRIDAVDVFSIGRGRYAGEICRWCRRPEFRPLLVRLDRTVVTKNEEVILDRRGYRCVASTPESVLYVHGPTPGKPSIETSKPSIRTFDIFDTLITRRCISPQGIFEAMGSAIGSPGFVDLRKRAEADVYGDAYTLGAIYERLGVMAGLSSQESAALSERELRAEIANAIPISENISKVGPTDVLVSDMYLSSDQISDLLRSAGFTGKNPILVRPRGKIDGTSWSDLKQEFSITQHLGDNRHADYDMALRYGIPARLTDVAGLSPIEDALAAAGFPRLTRTIREARLRTYDDEPEIRRFQDLQTQINFPLLMIAGLHLAHIVEKHMYDVVLMASRDCNLWIELVRYLASIGRFAARPVYLHTNRTLLREPTPPYRRYVRSLGGERPLFVDLVGTGLSVKLFSESVGSPLPAYLINDTAESAYASHEASRLRTDLRPVPHCLSRRAVPNSDLIEAVNTDLSGSLRDVVEIGATHIPRREPADLPAPVLRRVEAMHGAFRTCLQAMEANGVDDVPDDTAVLEQVGDSLLALLYSQDGGLVFNHHRQAELVRSEIEVQVRAGTDS